MRFCLITTAAATLASLFSCSHAVPLLAERTDLGSSIVHHGHRALSISTVQARGNHPRAVEYDEPVKILYITFDPFPRIIEQLSQRPRVPGISMMQADTIVKTFLASEVYPNHKIDPFFVNRYQGPGVEGTDILFYLHDTTKHAQCEFGCAGAVRRLGGHYFGMLNPMAYERLHGQRYPETLAYLGALEDGQNESSVTSRTLFVEYPPIYFRHNQPPTYILTHDEGAEPTTILPTSEQERLNELVRQNLERQKDYEHVDIRFLDRFVGTARFVDITVIYLRVIDSAKFYEARKITVVLNGSVMKPGKIQMFLGTGDEHYPDAHAL